MLIINPAAAFAGNKCSDINDWCPPSIGPVVTWTAPTRVKGELDVQGFFFYNRTRGVFDEEGHYKSFKNKETKYQVQEQLFVKYGLTDELEIDGLMTTTQNMAHVDGRSAESSGFGDTYMYLRYCFFEETLYIPHFTGLFQMKFPTGKYQKANDKRLGTDLMGATSGGGSYEQGWGINLTKRIKPFMLHADAALVFPILTRVDGIKTLYGNYVNWDLGAEYFFYKDFNLMVECNGFSQGNRKDNGTYVQASDVGSFVLSAGMAWCKSSFKSLIAYQRTLAGTNTDVNDSIVFTCEYTF